MTNEEIIKACLAEIPVGNIRVHTKENLPMMIREYVLRWAKMENIVERITDIIEEEHLN